jgi:lysophospholipase L1-like esterase
MKGTRLRPKNKDDVFDNTRHRYRSLFLGMIPALSVLLTFLAGEIGLRLYYRLWRGAPFFAAPESGGRITLDPSLGWRATENYVEVGTQKSLDDTEYPIHLSTDEYGFRMFGNLKSKKPKILVIGDSYTHATAVSDNKTYYSILKNSLDVEVFAYGVPGYGTLQQYLAIEKYFDMVKPDLLLWQFCTNDIINNSFELETASTLNNNGMVRPYWVAGRIEYIMPKNYTSLIRDLALRYSRFLGFIITRLDMIIATGLGPTVETDIKQQGWMQQGFVRSVQVTHELMGKVKNRVGDTVIAAFVAGTGPSYGPEYEEAFRQISAHYNIAFLDTESSVIAAEKRGVVVRHKDGGHWNEAGHRIVGNTLAESLKKNCLIKNLCNTP